MYKKTLFVAIAIAGIIYILSHAIPGRAVSGASQAPVPSCNCAGTNINFDGNVPGDMPFGIGSQQDANCFGWWEFITLNWPSSGNDFGKPLDMRPVQWQTFISRSELFPAEGAVPRPWNQHNLFMSTTMLRTASRLDRRLLSTTEYMEATSKFEENVSDGFDSLESEQAGLEKNPKWLGAQNGTNLWYDIRLNHDIYNFVVNNKYYDAHAQLDSVKAGKPIVFPSGQPTGNVTGAIEMKAAWMEVKDTTNVKWRRYKLARVAVVDPGSQNPRYTWVALVGLHILHKTQSQSTWVFATFEHVDNAPDNATDTGHYNFFNPHCRDTSFTVPKEALPFDTSRNPVTLSCIPNMNPPYKLGYGVPPLPIQVVRSNPIENRAKATNSFMQNAIRERFPSSVWQYYQLVNVMWSSNAPGLPDTPQVVPVNIPSSQPSEAYRVANVTLETYQQGTRCTDCHKNAKIAQIKGFENKYAADFSFALGTAKYKGFNALRRKLRMGK
ncbi:hypothetical protein [Chitinophaga sp.]|uniref:hypothetical protein n=1 Tax=Chitinophaga sp. TaxID=1869181 RepID=UPI0031E25034